MLSSIDARCTMWLTHLNKRLIPLNSLFLRPSVAPDNNSDCQQQNGGGDTK